MKKLPLGKYEKVGDETVVMLKMLSCRFPVKAMFMGVVVRLLPCHRFDGKIFLERVSQRVVVSNLRYHQKFTDDIILNQVIKNREWRDLFDCHSPLTTSKIITEVANCYALDEAILDHIELQYITFIGNAGNTKVIKLDHNENIFDLTIRTNEDKNLSETVKEHDRCPFRYINFIIDSLILRTV